MKKEKKIFGLKVYEFILIIGVLLLLVFILITKNDKLVDSHCKDAVCNEDKTVCYTYRVDDNGNTHVEWKGSCKLNK